MQDRKRLLSLPICPEPSHSNNLPQLPPNPPSGSAIVISHTAVNNSSANGASCSGSLKVKMVNRAIYLKQNLENASHFNALKIISSLSQF